MSFNVRAAKPEDAAAVAEIYAPYVRDTAVSFEVEPPDAETMARRMSSTLDMYPWLVAETGAGEVLGYAYAGRHRERPAYRWTIDTTIYIDLAHRRAGVGTRLYGALLEILRRQNFRSAFAEIVLPNPGSVGLHERLGFRKVGVHHDIGFKFGAWCDIGYWRFGLSSGTAPQAEPIPFLVFRGGVGICRGTRSERNPSCYAIGLSAWDCRVDVLTFSSSGTESLSVDAGPGG